MSLRDDVRSAQTEAMKARDSFRTGVLRNIWSAVRNEEIDARHELSNDEITAVIGRLVKQQKDALSDFRSGGRADLAENAEKEIAMMETYLPAQMADDELDAIIRRAIAETGAAGASAVGRVMGMVMKEVNGRADGTRVRERVTALLPQKGA